MLSSTVVVIRGLWLWYNKSNSRSIFWNKHFKTFLEGEMYKGKPTFLLVIKSLLFWYGTPSSLLHILIFFCTVFIFYNCNCKSSVQIIRKSFFQKQCTWHLIKKYLVKCSFLVFANLCEGNFLYCPMFVIIDTACRTWLKWSKTSFFAKIFVCFLKLLNISLDKYEILNHVKQVFQWR